MDRRCFRSVLAILGRIATERDARFPAFGDPASLVGGDVPVTADGRLTDRGCAPMPNSVLQDVALQLQVPFMGS
jgi:hypothetical protein